MTDLPHSIGKFVTSFDNTQIFYNILPATDTNRVLVFIHGLGGDSAAWNTERKLLHDKGYTTIAIDIRGHGLSDRPKYEGSYAIDNFVEDVIAVLKNEKLGKVVIIGHCFGAMIAMKLEAEHPMTAKALILIDTSYKPPFFSLKPADHRIVNTIISFITRHSPTIHQAGHVNTAKFYGTTDFSARRILSDVLHTSLRSYLKVCDAIAHVNVKDLLQKITVPTLVLVGTDDLVFPPEVAEDLQQRIVGADIQYIDGGDHIVIINKPEDVAKDIGEYLTKINY
jgi:3-oxoadipate enol-lactonase